MDKKEIFTRVAELMADYLNTDISYINLSSRVQHDLHIDSLEYIDIVLRLETAFDIKIAPIELEYLTTIDDIVNCIQVKLNKKNDL